MALIAGFLGIGEGGFLLTRPDWLFGAGIDCDEDSLREQNLRISEGGMIPIESHMSTSPILRASRM